MNILFGNKLSNTFIPDASADNLIIARGGDDFIFETPKPNLSSNDVYFTGSGNDTVQSWFGSDVVFAGTGDDVIGVRVRDDDIFLFGGKGDDTLKLYNAYNVSLDHLHIRGFEHIETVQTHHPDF